MTRLIRSLIWVAASTFAVGCAPTMMSTDADHNPPLRQMVEGDAPSVGAMEGPVTVFSILNTADASDRKTYVLIRKRVQQSEGKLRWVYRSKARGGAREVHAKALIAAQAQGKHWEFADRVADSRAALSESQLLALAEDLEMDSKAFEEVFTSPLTKARLDADSGYALKLGSSAQSTVWVNGRTIAPWSRTSLIAW